MSTQDTTVGRRPAPTRPALSRRIWRARLRTPWPGYLSAFAGVVVISLVIALIQTQTHIANISLLYLLAVLWVAASFGRGPAICAALLAFLAYDLFFIPPLLRLTVDDPTQWLSLVILLATALVAGQLTAAARARAQDAQQSRQRTETLYTLAQLIATTPDEPTLLDRLACWGCETFAPAEVRVCAVLQPAASGETVRRAVSAAPDAYALADEAILLSAAGEALASGEPIFRSLAGSGYTPDDLSLACILLRSNQQAVGVLALVGGEGMAALLEPQEGDTHGDQLAGVFGAYRDQLALALERAALRRQAIHAEAIQESDRLKTVLLGSVTHDLRTPLAGIKAAVTSLLTPAPRRSLATQRELLEAINSSADRLNRLVGNLLDFSRLEAGVAQLQLEWYTIDEVIVAALESLERAGQLGDRRIIVETPDDLPLTQIDHEQIERVMINLVENALKYSPTDAAIRITSCVVGDALETRVSDEGMGVAQSELDAIFERFYRGQQPEQSGEAHAPGGVGLGLAICASIIHAHGGRIWAESQPGHGATLVFTLPLSPERPLGALPQRQDTLAASAEATIEGAQV